MRRIYSFLFLLLSAHLINADTVTPFSLSSTLQSLKQSNRAVPKEFEVSRLDPEIVDVLNKYYRSLGGSESWGKIDTLLLKGLVRFPGGESLEFKNYRMKPDLNKLVLHLPNGYEIIQCFNGKEAWQWLTFEESKPILMTVEQSVNYIRDACLGGHLLYPQLEGKELLLGSGSTDSSTCQFVEVVLPNGQNIKYTLSVLGYLIAEETEISYSGVTRRVEMSDFKRISGTAIPFEGKTYIDGVLSQEVSIESVVLNKGVYSWMFEM